MPLGIEKGSITNAQIIATSQRDGHYQSYHARLNSKSGSWVPRRIDDKQWLRVDLGKKTWVTGIKTQGQWDAGYWVKSYYVSYGNDGSNFQTYQENDKDKVCSQLKIVP